MLNFYETGAGDEEEEEPGRYLMLPAPFERDNHVSHVDQFSSVLGKSDEEKKVGGS